MPRSRPPLVARRFALPPLAPGCRAAATAAAASSPLCGSPWRSKFWCWAAPPPPGPAPTCTGAAPWQEEGPAGGDGSSQERRAGGVAVCRCAAPGAHRPAAAPPPGRALPAWAAASRPACGRWRRWSPLPAASPPTTPTWPGASARWAAWVGSGGAWGCRGRALGGASQQQRRRRRAGPGAQPQAAKPATAGHRLRAAPHQLRAAPHQLRAAPRPVCRWSMPAAGRHPRLPGRLPVRLCRRGLRQLPDDGHRRRAVSGGNERRARDGRLPAALSSRRQRRCRCPSAPRSWPANPPPSAARPLAPVQAPAAARGERRRLRHFPQASNGGDRGVGAGQPSQPTVRRFAGGAPASVLLLPVSPQAQPRGDEAGGQRRQGVSAAFAAPVGAPCACLHGPEPTQPLCIEQGLVFHPRHLWPQVCAFWQTSITITRLPVSFFPLCLLPCNPIWRAPPSPMTPRAALLEACSWAPPRAPAASPPAHLLRVTCIRYSSAAPVLPGTAGVEV